MKINAAAFPYEKVKVKLFKCINDYKEFNDTIIIIDNRDPKVVECQASNTVSQYQVQQKINFIFFYKLKRSHMSFSFFLKKKL
jgi:hypothetical protein